MGMLMVVSPSYLKPPLTKVVPGHAKLIENPLAARSVTVTETSNSRLNIIVIDLCIQHCFYARLVTHLRICARLSGLDEFGEPNAEDIGWNIVFWRHDDANLEKRYVEITVFRYVPQDETAGMKVDIWAYGTWREATPSTEVHYPTWIPPHRLHVRLVPIQHTHQLVQVGYRFDDVLNTSTRRCV
jgi:hypothetical protein